MEEYWTKNTEQQYFLVDTNVNTDLFDGLEGMVYTEMLVAAEKAGGYFYKILSEDHILLSHTRQDFRWEGGTITMKAFDTYGPEAFVSYYTGGQTIYCGNCNAPTSGTLTSNNGIFYNVCQHLSSADFSLLVRTTGFSGIFRLITDEGCLGWSSALSESMSLLKQKKWYNHFYHV